MAMTEPQWNTLTTLCSENGWSYVIFWRIHPQNSLLLSVENVYYGDQLGEEIVNTLPKVHLMGEGFVGQAALTGKHRWVHSDAPTEELSVTGLHIFEDDSCLYQQFSSGIKTVAVISVKPCRVVQCGSKEKILERLEFVEKTQRLLMGIQDDEEKLYGWSLKYVDGDNSKMFLGMTYSSASLDDSSPIMDKNLKEGMIPIHGYSSHLGDQQTSTIAAHILSSDKDNTNSSITNLIAKNPSFGTWSGEVSSLESLGKQLVSEIRTQDVEDVHGKMENAFSCDKLAVQDSELTSLYSMHGLLGTFQDQIGNSPGIQHSAQSSIVTDSLSMVHELSKDLQPVDMLEELFKFFSMDDLCQLLAPSPEHSIYGTVTALDKSLELNPTSFGVVSSSGALDDEVPVTCQAPHSSLITAANLDGQETSTFMHSSGNSALDSMGIDLSCDQAEDWWGSMSTAATDTAFSDCIGGSRKRLFSELGIEELLNGSNFEDQLSTNRKRVVPAHEQPQKSVEHNKVTRKRARPGETTRPRPKDRQQIQDRIEELRGIIPNGGKCSIDHLLDRTIRYMLFLQSITKYADKLYEPNEPKLIEPKNEEVLKDSSMGGRKKCDGGITWAFEVGGQTMVCPIIVEDMGPPGQMLIEMLWEEQGSLLEMVDIIGGFGLNILKGKMEIREKKIWARFIVETPRVDSANKHCNISDAGFSSMSNYGKTDMPLLPIVMTETLG
ncbi:transcription factor bHLH157-like [Abrus precatorius]|uniref:Transcription factor bHLH157-like n=1 Tax=Abrus precatorius TaxID=3816 RepID=A0A8B8KQ39_ABRPR|nr:transcription factor bHLH157-like [Abrus precatorius]